MSGKDDKESGIVAKQSEPDRPAHGNQSQYGEGKSPSVRSVAGDIEDETEGERCKKCHAESDKGIQRQGPATFRIMRRCDYTGCQRGPTAVRGVATLIPFGGSNVMPDVSMRGPTAAREF